MTNMWSRIRHYLSVYQVFIITSLSEAMSYRLHFVMLVLMDLLFYGATLMSADIIYDHVALIGNWRREQLLFFLSIMLMINQLHMTFVSENFWIFPIHLRTGTLDFILLKPIHPLFPSFFRYIRVGSFFNIFITLGIVIYYGKLVGLSWLSWVVLVPSIVMGFLLLSILEMTIACSMFWMLEGTGINFLRIELQQLSRWPDFIYGSVARRLLTWVIPVLMIGNPAAKFLMDVHDFIPMIFMGIMTALVWGFLNFFWQLGLRTYESASS
ncbi:MAG: ABC-2 family transporter protein [SAR324 cluster bacterium]|nr:ABC-2 family transporter protein [SAR324 cluster bacterium]